MNDLALKGWWVKLRANISPYLQMTVGFFAAEEKLHRKSRVENTSYIFTRI